MSLIRRPLLVMMGACLMATEYPVAAQQQTSPTEEARNLQSDRGRGRRDRREAAPATDITTGSLIPLEESLNEGFGMPEWFVEAVRADDLRETRTVAQIELPYPPPDPVSSTSLPVGRQPAGFLSGKLIYLMAGHGWTFNRDAMSWYSQRGRTHGVVEDFGNHDQMCLFAHLAWNAGATIVPLRPVDHQTQERILDDKSQRVKFYGPWAGSEEAKSHRAHRNQPGYRFAVASLEENAVARFQPFIATPGPYPVYAWARDGADRVNQTYRVRHAGGITEVRVNHRMMGKGYVWLGTFQFGRGDSGYVEITNKVDDPYEADGRHVVIADGIRFGNGLGDVNRGGGISSWPREHEGDCYWIERSLGPSADSRIYIAETGDGNSTVMAPPRSSAYLNRETEGRYTDRFYLSFHSNALRGQARGAVALWNNAADNRTALQESFANIMGRVFDDEMKTFSKPGLPAWQSRANPTSNWITFGELRKDYTQNEMVTTIMETAFHDNAEDARLLLDSRARMAMAQGTLRGMLQWMRTHEPAASALVAPAETPSVLSVLAIDGQNSASLAWVQHAAVSPLQGGALTYRITQSADGEGFATVATTTATAFVVDLPDTTAPVFYRVSAINSGGESLPSAVGCVAVTTPPVLRVLVVNGFTTRDSSINTTESADGGVGAGFGPANSWQRVRPLRANLDSGAVSAALAAAGQGARISYASVEAIDPELLKTSRTDLMIWLAGRQSPDDGLMPDEVSKDLHDYVADGGTVFLSGARVIEGLERLPQGGLTPNYLGLRRGPDNHRWETMTVVQDAVTTRLLGIAVQPADGAGIHGVPHNTAVQTRDSTEQIMGIADDIGKGVGFGCRPGRSGAGRVFVLTVPFESVLEEETRSDLMTQVLKTLGLAGGERD